MNKLYKFWAPWCGPCKMFGPVVEEFVNERSDLQYVDVNVDDQPELAQAFGVRGVPTVVLTDEHDNVLQRIVGSTTLDQLREKIGA